MYVCKENETQLTGIFGEVAVVIHYVFWLIEA